MKIESTTNPKVKYLTSLRSKRSLRDADNVFTVEGFKEIIRAINGSFKLKEFYFCRSLLHLESQALTTNLLQNSSTRCFELSQKVYEKIAVREGSDGILAIFEQKHYTFNDINYKQSSTIVVLEDVEKPGNLGAILRSADGIQASAIIINDKTVDPYNANCIRASIGTVFNIPVIIASKDDTLKFLNQNKFQTIATTPHTDKAYYDIDYTKNSAIILGAESTGLSDFWINNSNYRVSIPMRGIADSLNVSAAAAIILYEALRQKSL